jgi:hypothetical protein
MNMRKMNPNKSFFQNKFIELLPPHQLAQTNNKYKSKYPKHTLKDKMIAEQTMTNAKPKITSRVYPQTPPKKLHERLISKNNHFKPQFKPPNNHQFLLRNDYNDDDDTPN